MMLLRNGESGSEVGLDRGEYIASENMHGDMEFFTTYSAF